MQPQDLLVNHVRLLEPQKRALRKLGIHTLQDLLFHFPTRYERAGEQGTVSALEPGTDVVLTGTIRKPTIRKTWKSKTPIAEALLEDRTGKIKLMWFHQPYLAKSFPDGATVKVKGRVTGSPPFLANPEIEHVGALPLGVAGSMFQSDNDPDELFALYPESQGITSRWFRHTITKVLRSGLAQQIEDPIPTEILNRYHLPGIHSALVWVHQPKNDRDATSARKRFAFEEVFVIQCAKQRERAELSREPTIVLVDGPTKAQAFIERLPFTLTQGQQAAIEAILKDMSSPPAMSRLLEGDVGSGKTAVAAASAYAVVTSAPKGRPSATLQVAYMAPTEILAQQHFEAFVSLYKHLPIQMALMTGSVCKKFPSKTNPGGSVKITKTQLLKWVASGEITVLIGTHALIQKSVRFRDLAYVIIDEQHRFGVNQRQALMRRSTQNGRGSTQNPSEEHPPALLYEELTYAIRGAAFAVKTKLGIGHKESVYQNALDIELRSRHISFQREVQLPVCYDNKKVGYYQPDFLIDGKIILELKALPRISQENQRQAWDYLRGSTYRLALLINFGSQEMTIKRIVFDEARDLPRESAQQVCMPHLLTMTATPIPRTLALTLYGDLDLTVLDEMPAGRKRIITEIVQKGGRAAMYASVRRELDEGRQAYVICPRIDEPDPEKEMAVLTKSVLAEAERLRVQELRGYRIGILHGQMKPAEKDSVMRSFLAHDLDILVATSVVEVGVNVPNATVIVIEGAERFGLAQLHQLRGRVVRSNHQAYCFVLTSEDRANSRLKALEKAKNGFELAELDLKLRGPGELYGRSQSGLSDLGMEALKNLKLVEAARDEAVRLVAADPELAEHPVLLATMKRQEAKLHFE